MAHNAKKKKGQRLKSSDIAVNAVAAAASCLRHGRLTRAVQFPWTFFTHPPWRLPCT